jgi:hypothetical protein
MLPACPLSVPVPDCLSFNPLQRPVIWCDQVLFLYPSSKVSAAGHVHVIMCGHGAGVARVNFALGSFVTPACTFYRE